MSGALPTIPRPRLDIRLLVAGSAAFSTSTMFSSMKPVLISRFVEEAHYSPRMAGLAAAMPFVGGMFASAILPATMRRCRADSAIVIFGLLLAVAEATNAFLIATPALLLLGQFFAGVCGGILLGLTSRSIALSARAGQSFGIVDMVGVLLMSAMIAVVGAAVQRAGLRGGFLCASLLCAVFALALIGSRRALASGPGAGAGTNAGERRVPHDIGWRAAMVVAMGVAFVTFSGLGFAFMFTAARRLGFSYQAAGSAIGVILFVSAIGCLIGGWCAGQFGAQRSLIGAFALCGFGWQIALTTHSPMVFLLALAPAIFALQFSFPILLALAASFDTEGRMAAVAAPLIVSGFAWAAIIAGLVVDRWSLSALPVVTEVGMAFCTVLLLIVATSRKSFRTTAAAGKSL